MEKPSMLDDLKDSDKFVGRHLLLDVAKLVDAKKRVNV